MMHTTELLFTRVEGMRGVTTLAVVQVQLEDWVSSDAIMQALERAVREWVTNTREGKRLWSDSVEDLNIGDLASHGIDGLRPFLKKHGIVTMNFLYVGGTRKAYAFDRVLVKGM